MQAFRLQLALQTGHQEETGPGILDERLHVKPHHQPILFVDDSQAPNVQLFSPAKASLQPADQIAASHAAVNAALPSDGSHGQSKPGHGLMQNPKGKSYGSLDEAESISSSPPAASRSFMHRLLSHGNRGLSHSHITKHDSGSASFSTPRSETSESSLLRHGSSKSSSSRLHAQGPSHGSDSRFAAMKSLTRHAISLDSPTTLSATRRHGTLIPRRALPPGQDAHTSFDVALGGYDYDLGDQLSRASSMSGSGAGSFTDAHISHAPASSGLAHLHSAPPGLSKQNSAEDIVSLKSMQEVTTPSAPLLDRHMQLDNCLQSAVVSNADSLLAHAADAGSTTAMDHASALTEGGHSKGVAIFAPALHCAAQPTAAVAEARQSAVTDAMLLPLSQDSLDFTLLDPDSLLKRQDSQSQQLLQPAADVSTPMMSGASQPSDFPSVESAQQVPCELPQQLPAELASHAPSQHLSCDMSRHLRQQLEPELSSCGSSQQLLQHLPTESLSADQDQQLLQQPALGFSAANLDQQLLQKLDHTSSSPQGDEQPPAQLPLHAYPPALTALHLPLQTDQLSISEAAADADQISLLSSAAAAHQGPQASVQAPPGAVHAELSESSISQMLNPPQELSHSVSVPGALGSVPMLPPFFKAPTIQPIVQSAPCSGDAAPSAALAGPSVAVEIGSSRLTSPPEERQQVPSAPFLHVSDQLHMFILSA